MSRTVLNLNGECGTSCVHGCEAVGGDVAVCVDAGEDGFLSDCAMLYFTLCVECRGIVGSISYSLISSSTNIIINLLF